jgi:hypothetical protein
MVRVIHRSVWQRCVAVAHNLAHLHAVNILQATMLLSVHMMNDATCGLPSFISLDHRAARACRRKRKGKGERKKGNELWMKRSLTPGSLVVSCTLSSAVCL